jgi:hypothetical protein
MRFILTHGFKIALNPFHSDSNRKIDLKKRIFLTHRFPVLLECARARVKAISVPNGKCLRKQTYWANGSSVDRKNGGNIS